MWYMYTMECYSVIEKKNNTICNNIDGARDDDIKWSKSDRETEIWCDITYMQNLKKNYSNELILQNRNRLIDIENKRMVG